MKTPLYHPLGLSDLVQRGGIGEWGVEGGVGVRVGVRDGETGRRGGGETGRRGRRRYDRR